MDFQALNDRTYTEILPRNSREGDVAVFTDIATRDCFSLELTRFSRSGCHRFDADLKISGIPDPSGYTLHIKPSDGFLSIALGVEIELLERARDHREVTLRYRLWRKYGLYFPKGEKADIFAGPQMIPNRVAGLSARARRGLAQGIRYYSALQERS